MKKELTAAIVFSSMTVFENFERVLHMGFMYTEKTITGWVSLNRVNEFMQEVRRYFIIILTQCVTQNHRQSSSTHSPRRVHPLLLTLRWFRQVMISDSTMPPLPGRASTSKAHQRLLNDVSPCELTETSSSLLDKLALSWALRHLERHRSSWPYSVRKGGM